MKWSVWASRSAFLQRKFPEDPCCFSHQWVRYVPKSRIIGEELVNGIPGLRGTEHIGFTVPSLDLAHTFFVDVIGCEYMYSLGPLAHEDNWMAEHLNVDPRSRVREIRFYRCQYGSNFELFEYSAGDSQQEQPRNSDIGGHHLAFYVDDLDAAVEYLIERGVRVLGGPNLSTGSSRGQRWIYFLSPWGMQLELVSYQDGKAYEEEAPRLLWHPAHPDR